MKMTPPEDFGGMTHKGQVIEGEGPHEVHDDEIEIFRAHGFTEYVEPELDEEGAPVKRGPGRPRKDAQA